MKNNIKNYALLNDENDLVLTYKHRNSFDENEIDTDMILQFIRLHQKELVPVFKKAENYYKNKDKSITKKKTEEWRYGDKRMVPFTEKIINNIEGYAMGNDAKLKISDDNELLRESIQEFMDMNMFKEKIKTLSKKSSIYGRSFIYLELNDSNNTIASVLPVYTTFLVFSSDSKKECLFGVTYQPDLSNFIVYTRNYVKEYNKLKNKNSYYEDVYINFYGDIPIVQFNNDEYKSPRTQNIYQLIDLYEYILNGTSDEILNNAASILKIIGIEIPEYYNPEEDDPDKLIPVDPGAYLSDMIKNGILYARTASKDGYDTDKIEKPDVDYISRNSTTLSNKEFLIDIETLIYNQANVIDYNKEIGNSSGSALEQRMQPMKQEANNKYSSMNQSLRQVIKLLCNYDVLWDIPGISYDDWMYVSFEFTPTKVKDVSSDIENFVKLGGKLSNKTKLKFLGDLIEDVDLEEQTILDEEKALRSEVAKRLNNGDRL